METLSNNPNCVGEKGGSEWFDKDERRLAHSTVKTVGSFVGKVQVVGGFQLGLGHL